MGSDKDFPLTQAILQLKGLPVTASKSQVERKTAAQEE
jgi:carboxyl-terminal processing protease